MDNTFVVLIKQLWKLNIENHRQLVEDPQKNDNIESGKNEKLELIFLIGTSPVRP